MSKPDAYELLGVPRDADEREIKRAFRRRARELHPDVNKDDPQAEEKFKQLAEAYEVLSDPERRAIYDRYGWAGLEQRGFQATARSFSSFSDIFEAFFGSDPFSAFFGGQGTAGRTPGDDIELEVEVDLALAARGGSVDVEYDAVDVCEQCGGSGAEAGSGMIACGRCGGAGQLRQVVSTPFGRVVRSETCSACGGAGLVPARRCQRCGGSGLVETRRKLEVGVPAGIADGQRIRLSGRGHAGPGGAPPGDLYLLVRVREDERFLRDGADLVTAVRISMVDAALGTTVTVPTVDGGERAIELPPGTQPGTVVTLRGLGMPRIGGRGRGDLRVVVDVEIPAATDGKARELLESLRSELGGGEANGVRQRAGEAGGGHLGIVERLRRVLR